MSDRTASGDVAKGRPSVIKTVGLTTLITGLGYAVTLIQQVLYARALGVNAETDALGGALAWAVGTTGLVGTTLATVFLPRYVRSAGGPGGNGAQELRAAGTRLSLALGGALAVTTFLGAPLLATVLAPGGAEERRQIITELLRLAAPLEMTWPLVWRAVSTANARERYALAAASAILPPLPVIGLLIAGPATVHQVAIAYVAGTLLQLLALWGVEPAARPAIRTSSPDLPTVGRELLPAGLAFGLLSLIPLEVRALASLHGVGDVAVVDYASRLVLAGQQVLLSGLLAVTFTRWSRREDEAAGPSVAIDSIDRTLGGIAIAGALVAIALPLLGVPLTRLVFVGGRFGEQDASAVGSFIAWMGLGVAGHMVLMVAIRALFAMGHAGSVIVAAAGASAAVPVIGWLAQPIVGLDGVAIAYSVGYLLAAAVACIALRRRSRSRESAIATRQESMRRTNASQMAAQEVAR